MNNDLIDYIDDQRVWSRKTFGEGKRTEGILKHIEKEIAEVRSSATDQERMEELGDIVILALDGMWRLGFEPYQIWEWLDCKQRVNMERTYPFPVSENEPSEHIR